MRNYGAARAPAAHASSYDVLGVAPGATAEEIKRAYRKLAKESHPDAGGDPERFHAVRRAYEELRKSQPLRDALRRKRKRAEASETKADDAEGPARPFGKADNSRFEASEADWPRRYESHISLELASQGGETELALADGRRIAVRVPAGVENGRSLRLKELGPRPAPTAPRDDAFVDLTVEPHPLFERKGDDIHSNLRAPWIASALGLKVRASTAGGPVMVKIPRGGRTGKTLRLDGAGFAGRGDHHFRLKVVEPRWVGAARVIGRRVRPMIAGRVRAAYARYERFAETMRARVKRWRGGPLDDAEIEQLRKRMENTLRSAK